jgi:hypothetical protein
MNVGEEEKSINMMIREELKMWELKIFGAFRNMILQFG